MTKILWEVASRTPWRRHLYHRYEYSFTPAQLAVIVRAADDGLRVDGTFLEVGCAYGHTTVLLNKHLDYRGVERRYVCIDTFSGFTAEDARVENEERGKGFDYSRLYADVTLKTFERNLANNGITRVEAVQADANVFDFDRVRPVAFAMLDVDLYRPMKRSIAEVFDRLAPGGGIVCDDCDPGIPAYDGASQAYLEFTAERGLEPEVLEGKLGILRR